MLWVILAVVTLGLFYYSKVEFTTVDTFSNVTSFSHFTMLNTDLVCCGGNGGRMKAKFTIVNFPKMIWFIADISKLCLFSWHLVALFEMRSLSVTLLNTYTCIFSAASLFFSFFRAKQYSRDVTVTQTIFAFIRGKSTVNSGFQGIIRLHLMFVFHFWVEHKFRSKSFNSSVFLFRVATFFLSIVWIWILVGTLFLRNLHVLFTLEFHRSSIVS